MANRYKIVKTQAYCVLAGLVLIGGVAGFLVGKYTTSTEVEIQTQTITKVETVEVPTADVSQLPTITDDVTYFDVPLSQSLQRYIYEICADEDVPVTLVMAMIEHESLFDVECVSSTDDYGLMAINEINHSQLAEEYRCADMLNSYQNVFCGIKIIASYLDKYDGDYTKALMAYNMGEYGATKAWENGITSTNYTESVLALMATYEEVLNGNE